MNFNFADRFKTKTFDNGYLVDNSRNYVGEDWSIFGARQGTMNKRIQNIKSRGVRQSKRVRGVNSGIFSKAESNHTYISDSILLYMPPEGMKFTYSASYEALDTNLAGDLGAGLAGMVNAEDFEGFIQGLGKTASVGPEMAKMAGFGVLSLIPGFESSRELYDKSVSYTPLTLPTILLV